ncbi:bifunctional hydroxymethylpyrimidine kinase/phosphomethylpyrimidine kinase [Natronolimnobius sp. AArcel1]|uniref:bifunctional hydroxymethylpyrimidine kinase/phosphomethylpyrimidine kinase n=1 Tax=Natronolimnobius sp. AArcel1 TaxID=1679093 RepID=UPI0013EA0283|nr:bifunctional hydroxymethylpyrimidine kinase/phosphomethylpyrimidine kinase [Natronolimnobius sp. AArcel1]NGM68070.1 bifunctional hydroxymethylpyrimidine kinase/phosphomethylpyrimidine kinase [Natronolimnobius sp. AArcel1]
MRTPAPETRPIALTIAGSDSGGGAGIQADLATMAAHGVFGTSAITAVTAQHTRGVESSFALPTAEVEAQIDAVTDDFAVGAAKTGMLATTEIVETVAGHAREFDFPLVVDPVMVATTGDRLLEPAAERAYENLLGEATLATPNADEAEVLTGIAVEDADSAREAGNELLETDVDAALIKGGHVPGEQVQDILVTADGSQTFEHPRIDTEATHGSGCSLAAALAARLANGDPLADAVAGATDFLARAVRYYYDVGEGPGAVNHAVDLRNAAAREATTEEVEIILERVVTADVSALVPEVGMNIVGATPYAESVDETAAVEGRIHRTLSGVQPTRGVRFGASSHVAGVLLELRESVPDLRFAVNCRFDDAFEEALETLEWDIAEAGEADARDTAPAVVLEAGGDSTEPMAYVVATDLQTLLERVLRLDETVEDAERSTRS